VPAANIAVVEGMMGLFDGVGSGDTGGSSADIARRLGLPVILVLDVRAMAGSAGAAALGYREYDADLDFSGVILNNVAGEHHAEACRQALESIGITIFGVVPINEKLRLPDRHLGLIPTWERSGPTTNVEEMALEVASHLDLDAILEVAGSAVPATLTASPRPSPSPSELTATIGRAVRIGVARDDAFGFYYQDTLDVLAAAGAELVIFRPTSDEALPPDLGGLYLGGGFPERHLDALEANIPLRDEIRARAEDGMPILAECGGLMYLCRSISIGGFRKAMVGVFDGHARMGARQAVAYVDVAVERDTPLAPKGSRLRGHVFHNSVIDGIDDDAEFAYALSPGPGIADRQDGWIYRNVVASYTHLPLAAYPELIDRWLEICRTYRATTPPQRTVP
jgi:cobyrinic acid a,c-diamide synthase